MDKETILNQIRSLAAMKIATRREMVDAINEGAGFVGRRFSIPNILSILGGIVVCLGIVVLVGENWSYLSSAVRVVVTLGAALVALATGLILFSTKEHNVVSEVFFLVSGLLFPIGMFVVFDVAGFDMGAGISTIAAIICSVVMGIILYFTRSLVPLVFTIAFATWLYFSGFVYIVGNNPIFATSTFYEILVMVIGIAYILLGKAFSTSSPVQKILSHILYALGTAGFLGGALGIGGFIDAIYIFLVAVVIYGSTRLGSKSMLAFGSMFLMAYIIKLTGKYFADSLGWPLALVLCGLVLIGIGYGGVYIGKKYLKAA